MAVKKHIPDEDEETEYAVAELYDSIDALTKEVDRERVLNAFKSLKLTELIDIALMDPRNRNFIEPIKRAFSEQLNNRCMQFNAAHLSSLDMSKRDLGRYFFIIFGSFITKLSIRHLKSDQIAMEDDILKHITNVVDLVMISCNKAFERINTSFENVKRLYLDNCYIGENFSSFNIWFPNLQRLTLINIKHGSDTKSMVANYPSMYELTIEDDLQKTPMTTINRLLRMNPQLRSFCMEREYDDDFLRFIDLPKLNTLYLSVPKNRFEDFDEDEKIYFESVTSFALIEKKSKEENFVSNIPFKFSKLEKIKLVSASNLTYDTFDFIKQHKQLKVLTILTKYNTDGYLYENILSVLKELPHLETFIIANDCLDLFEFRDLLKEIRKLNISHFSIKFSSMWDSQTFYKKLINNITDNWTFTSYYSGHTDWGCGLHCHAERPELYFESGTDQSN